MQIIRPESKQPIPAHAKRVFEGKIFDIYQWEQLLYDGSKAIFEKAKRKSDSVGVLPITETGKILLTKQEQPQEKPFIGAIGGRMDQGETPLETAKREMLEEAGLEAENWDLFLAVQYDLKVDWVCYTFIAKGLTQKERALEAGEKIEIIEVSFDEYMDIILEDDYRDPEIAFHILKAKQKPQEFEKIRELFTA